MKQRSNKATKASIILLLFIIVLSMQSLAQTRASAPCTCNIDMYLIANPGGFKIRCGQTHLFAYNNNITLAPQNICNPATCISKWNINVYDAQTGVPVKSGTGTGNSSTFGVTLNSHAGLRVEFYGNCSGKKCNCEFWIKPKP